MMKVTKVGDVAARRTLSAGEIAAMRAAQSAALWREDGTLKLFAQQRNLMVMGPDCGTAIIAGVGQGFANRVPRGRIGIVGASLAVGSLVREHQ